MLLQTLLWIISITAFSLFGSWYARRYDKVDALVGLYVAFVLTSNIVAYKIAEFDLGFTKFYSDSATLVFAVTFLLSDIVNEKFGREETQKMIFITFITQVAIAFFIWLAISLQPAPFWTEQENFAQIIGYTPRIMIASWVALLVSGNIDAYIFDWFKKLTKGKHLWMRNAFSSIPAMALDTVIFVIIAFAGVQPLLPIIVGTMAIKWLVGIIDIPFMYLNRMILYKK
jgi:uncharacterized integral membrane protein (TIGR00697 family)